MGKNLVKSVWFKTLGTKLNQDDKGLFLFFQESQKNNFVVMADYKC